MSARAGRLRKLLELRALGEALGRARREDARAAFEGLARERRRAEAGMGELLAAADLEDEPGWFARRRSAGLLGDEALRLVPRLEDAAGELERKRQAWLELHRRYREAEVLLEGVRRSEAIEEARREQRQLDDWHLLRPDA